MNKFFLSLLMACWAALLLLSACSSAVSDKKKAITLNDEAYTISWKVIGNEWPTDSLDRAVELYRQAISLDSTFGLAYHNLYSSLVLWKKYEEAEDECSEWINRHPNDYTFRLRKANLQWIQGKQHLANAEYAHIVEYLDNLPAMKVND